MSLNYPNNLQCA